MPDDRVIAGKYRLINKLSEGGMGSVWRAEHLELNCDAAVKLLDPAFAESAEAFARFKREAQSAASLRSTNIVQIFDFGLDDGVPYIAMELLRGQSLSERLSQKSPLSPRETGIILTQVAKAVTWAHGMGIVHRDLKPGNIFLSEDAGETVVKLVDFGIAKPLRLELTDAPVTLTGSIMGTPQYMSPEQASGRRTVDHRTDIWSFGIVAFECLTGYHAFSADTLGGLLLAICTDPMPVPSHFAQVPTGFDEWFAHCAHREPSLRFLSIAEAADVLRFVCGLEITSSFAAVPQLYSEPPPMPYTAMAPGHATRLRAYSGASSTTDAPSILTLAEGALLRKRYQNWYFLGAVFVAALLVVAVVRFSARTPSVSSSTSTTVPGIASDTHDATRQAPSSPPQPSAEALTARPDPTPAALGSTDNEPSAHSNSGAASASSTPPQVPQRRSEPARQSAIPPKPMSRAARSLSASSSTSASSGASKDQQSAALDSETVESVFGLSRKRTGTQ